MLHSLSLRWKIMIALLGLSLLPLLLVSIFFSQVTDSHFSEELKEKAQRTKRFVLESSRAMQT
ncbi:MAG: hypothetical protein L3J63_09055, partial [Geopsychrobacter sp.]|nr:hypothetical protein [Geopsychrobacter sp.]